MIAQIHEQHFIERWGRVLYGQNRIDVIHFLQGKALLSVQKTCYACNRNMTLEEYNQM